MKSKILFTISIFCCGALFINLFAGWRGKPENVPTATITASVQKGLALLEKSGYTFTAGNRFKCAGCHHQSLTAMAVELTRQKGIPGVDSFTSNRIKAMERTLINGCNPNLIDQFVPVNFALPYILMGLAAEKYAPNINTDMGVDYLMGQARTDGSFPAESGRAPLQCGDIHLAAMAIRAIQLYAPSARRDRAKDMVARTRQWLEQQNPNHQQEMVFQLLGMYWCGSDRAKLEKVAGKLQSMQHADGGWSQLSTMASDAYATGQTLYALYESGTAKTEDGLYQKGIGYLLKTQDESGAWIVETRSYPIQPYFSSNFPPYDENQYISATASNWSLMALAAALPDKIIRHL